MSVSFRRLAPVTLVALSAALVACSDRSSEAPAAEGRTAQVDANAPVTARPHETRTIPVNIQGVTDVGATVRVKRVDLGEDATILDVSISFASNMTHNVDMATNDTFIETPAGQRLMLKRPEGNPRMTIADGDTMEGRLVFLGAVPANAESISLVFNHGSTSDSIIGPFLRLNIPLRAS